MIVRNRLFPRATLPLYAGTGLLAAAMILYEVALTRIFSIAYGYHFAFLAISLGLLGFGVSGTLIALRPRWIERLTSAGLASLSLLAACSFIAGYLVANNVPFDPYRVGWAPGQLPLLAAYLASLAIPFMLIGLVLGLPLAAWPHRASYLYGANLMGSGAGGLLALFVLDMLRAENALVISGGIAALASAAFSWNRQPEPTGSHPRRLMLAALLATGGFAAVASTDPGWLDVKLSPYKPLPQLLNLPDADLVDRESSALARIDVVDSSSIHSAPGLSLQYEGLLPRQSAVVLDGDTVIPLTSSDGLEEGFFDAMPTALVQRLRSKPQVLMLEAGGGLEVAAAINGGATKVVALERNPQLARMYETTLAARSGGVYKHPRVQLLARNPRSYLTSERQRFDVVSLSLSESRRTVTAGAFSLSENYLLTSEAFKQYFDHLRPNGMVVVHRWLQLPPTEEVRAAALVIDALRGAGAAPDRNIIAIRSFSTMLIVAKLEPFTSREIATAKDFVTGRQFDFVHYPGIQPSETNLSNVLRNDRYFSSFQSMLSDQQRFYRDYEYEVRPPADDRPFFFHFFRWGQTPTVLRLLGKTWQPFGGSGYLIVLALLVVTALLSLALILLPAWAIRRRERGLGQPQGWVRPVTYFGALGLGFLLVEVALVGRLILFLDHSALSFTVVLFGLLVSSGLGSAWSARIPWRPALAVLVGVILLYAAFLPPISSVLLGQALGVRVVITLLFLTPLGFLMGIAFPNGLRWIGAERPSWLPMAWGVNGFTSVIGAIIAAMIALSWGFTAVLACGAAAYLTALAAIWRRSSLPAPTADPPFQAVSSAPLAD